MVRLTQSTRVGKKKVYDVTVADTHSFFAYSKHGSPHHAVLAHNCHELSRQAFDSLLLPMEDNRPGSEDKKLVCIFCTTEPGKMRPAVLSRCAPPFTVRACTPAQIAERLGQICEAEEISYEKKALELVAEATECHIRDALKAVEGVAHLGGVTVDHVREYLSLDANTLYLEVLDYLGSQLQKLLEVSLRLAERVSPATAYANLAEIAMLAYRSANLEVGQVPSYLDKAKLKEVGDKHGAFLIEAGMRFASRPSRVSKSMLLCDLAALHQLAIGAVTTVTRTETPVQVSSPRPGPSPQPTSSQPEPPPARTAESQVHSTPSEATSKEENDGTVEGRITSDGVYVDPRALARPRGETKKTGKVRTLSPEVFAQRLDERLQELAEEHGGSS